MTMRNIHEEERKKYGFEFFEESMRLYDWLEVNRDAYSLKILNEFKPLLMALEDYFYENLCFSYNDVWDYEEYEDEDDRDVVFDALKSRLHYCSDRWGNLRVLQIKMLLQRLAELDGHDNRTTVKHMRLQDEEKWKRERTWRRYSEHNLRTPKRRLGW